jgi:hypothetical protein
MNRGMIVLPASTHAAIKKLAAMGGFTMAKIVNKILIEFLRQCNSIDELKEFMETIPEFNFPEASVHVPNTESRQQ